MSVYSEGRRNVLKTLGAGAAAAAGGIPLLSSAQAETAVVASILPLSGALAQYGQEMAKGVDIAVEAINRKGLKVAGKTYQITLKTYDDKSDATTAARLTERAADADGADLVIAGCGSVIAKSIIPVAQRMRKPVMAQWAQVDGVFAGQKGNPYYFGTMPPFRKMYELIWPQLRELKDPKLQNVAMISPNDELGVFVAKDLPAQLKSHGLNHVHTELFPPTTQDFGAALERCARENPDVLLINCYTPQIIAIFKQMQAVKFFPPAVVVEAPTRLAESIGTDINGAFVPVFWAPSLTGTKDDFIGTSKDFADAYKAKFGDAPSDFVAAAGAANLMVYAQVAARAGTVREPEALLKAFRAYDGQTFFSSTKYADDGLNEKGVCYAAQFQGGKPQLVYPSNIRQVQPISPFPASKKA